MDTESNVSQEAIEVFEIKERGHTKKNLFEMACFGAGCFWGIQYKFDQLKGVIKTEVGYMGGQKDEPSYKEVCSDTTGHAEVVRVEFDPKIVSYGELVDLFFSLHNPTQRNRQGVDIGSQYRSVIFYYSEAQHEIALKKFMDLQRSDKYGDDLVTEIIPDLKFWVAEKYHQKYLENKGIDSCDI